MDRRLFLRGLFAAPAVVAASSLMPISIKPFLPPKLWGDGVHDDTAALQWMFDNMTVVDLDGKTYTVTSPLQIRTSNLTVTNGQILWRPKQITSEPFVIVA